VFDATGQLAASYATPYETRLQTLAGNYWTLTVDPIVRQHHRALRDTIQQALQLSSHDAQLARRQAVLEAQRFGRPEQVVRAGYLAEALMAQLDAALAQQQLPFFVLPRLREVEQAMAEAVAD